MRRLWQGELWEDSEWLRRFVVTRDLNGRHGGTIQVAKDNYLKNATPLIPNHDFLLAEYAAGDTGRPDREEEHKRYRERFQEYLRKNQ